MVKFSRRWAVVHRPSGEVVSTHDTKAEARMMASQDQKMQRAPRGVFGVSPTIEIDDAECQRLGLERLPVRVPARLRRRHERGGGDACTEGADGTCEGCGVAMTSCDACGGRGYHRKGCAE